MNNLTKCDYVDGEMPQRPPVQRNRMPGMYTDVWRNRNAQGAQDRAHDILMTQLNLFGGLNHQHK